MEQLSRATREIFLAALGLGFTSLLRRPVPRASVKAENGRAGQRHVLAQEAGALPRSVGAWQIRPCHQPPHPQGMRFSGLERISKYQGGSLGGSRRA